MLSAKFQLLFMTEHELDQLRREKWRLNGRPVRTLDDARAFIESVGFCMMYPMRPPLLAPTFIGASGGRISFVALDHALGELWAGLRIPRVDYNPAEGSYWDVLYRWSPDAVREGIGLSVGEALSALLSKYLDCVIAADQQEIEAFFGNFVPRSRVREAVNALLTARELDFIRAGTRSLIQITPPKAPAISKGRVDARPGRP